MIRWIWISFSTKQEAENHLANLFAQNIWAQGPISKDGKFFVVTGQSL